MTEPTLSSSDATGDVPGDAIRLDSERADQPDLGSEEARVGADGAQDQPRADASDPLRDFTATFWADSGHDAALGSADVPPPKQYALREGRRLVEPAVVHVVGSAAESAGGEADGDSVAETDGVGEADGVAKVDSAIGVDGAGEAEGAAEVNGAGGVDGVAEVDGAGGTDLAEDEGGAAETDGAGEAHGVAEADGPGGAGGVAEASGVGEVDELSAVDGVAEVGGTAATDGAGEAHDVREVDGVAKVDGSSEADDSGKADGVAETDDVGRGGGTVETDGMAEVGGVPEVGGVAETDDAEAADEVSEVDGVAEGDGVAEPRELVLVGAAKAPLSNLRSAVRRRSVTGLFSGAHRWRAVRGESGGAARLSVVERLRDGLPTDRHDRYLSWVVTIALVALGFSIRLIGVDSPPDLIFDETYYPKEAWSLLQVGYEQNWVEGANEILVDGDYSKAQEKDPSAIEAYCPDGVETCDWNGLKNEPAFIVHPQLGKWLIAAGIKVFGFNSFGWRFPSVVFGALMILAVVRLGRRVSRSTLVGGLAGLLVTFDGLAFVMSRIGLLDIFQATFLVFAVAAVVADRDHFRHKLADRIEARGSPDLDGTSGGFVFRPWLIAAGLMFGLACSVKWNSMYPLAAFGLLVVAWSISARRLAGARHRRWDSLWLDGVPAFASMVLLAVVVYVASWASWLMTDGGYLRQWGAENPDDPMVKVFGPALGSLWHYQVDTYNFHTGDYMHDVTHSYRANPFGWLLLLRPICFASVGGIQRGDQGCTAEPGSDCLRVVYAQGTPLLWWLAAFALIAGLIWWVAGADWRFGVTTLAALSTWVPWLMEVGGRPLFFFYAITIIPFSSIGLAMAFGVILGPAHAGRRRFVGAVIVGVLVALII
ncbi:MAG: glycosyltransferase family 39 protein, partial [Propionibacteriaceae bacterium]|nr:glycosyltransferase family 39 protein [Propionibacteriaceae bacterium]